MTCSLFSLLLRPYCISSRNKIKGPDVFQCKKLDMRSFKCMQKKTRSNKRLNESSDLIAPWDKQLIQTAETADTWDDITWPDMVVVIIAALPVHSGLCWWTLHTSSLLNQNKLKGWKDMIYNLEAAPATFIQRSWINEANCYLLA